MRSAPALEDLQPKADADQKLSGSWGFAAFFCFRAVVFMGVEGFGGIGLAANSRNPFH